MIQQNSDTNSKISGNLRQYYRDEAALNNTGAIIDFLDDGSNRLHLNSKQRQEKKQAKMGQKMVPLKYL